MKTSVALATLALSASVALAGYDTPQQTVAAIGAALTSQKAPSVTEFLPASYQKDLADVAQLFGQKMDPELWTGLTDFVSAATKTVATKANLIVDDDLKGADRAAAAKSLSNGLTSFSTFLSSDAAKLDTLKAGNILPAVDAVVSLVLSIASANESPEDLAKAFKVLDSKTLDNGDVSLTFANDEFSENIVGARGVGNVSDTVTFRKVEGCWLPVSIADGWKEGVADIRQSIERIDFTSTEGKQQKSQLLMMLPMMKGQIGNIAKAQTADELEQSAGMLLMPLMMMGGGAGIPMLQ